ncbi:replication initiation protein [Cysteiniphilum sp. 6C5]|uniref:replication initiation protein n=1 Tax=unclassified Cysteiniphilum TaxID=2610889 RepID=UPI003F8519D1
MHKDMNAIVTKSNDLIDANYSFSLNEYRILMYAVSYVNPMTKEFPYILDINVKEFAKFFDIEVDGIYYDLKEAITKRFFRRELTIDLPEGEKKLCHWLDSLTYHNGKSTLKLEFSKNVIPLLTNLVQKFTSYHLEQIADMKSIYAIRVYEFCILEINRKKRNLCEFIIKIECFKKRLNLIDKYSRYCDLKSRVLTRAKTEINEHSDLLIDFEEIKQGRTVESIKFIVRRKEGTQPARYQRIEEEPPRPISINQLPTAEEMAQDFAKESLKERLINFGVAESVADKLVNNHSTGFIEKHIDYTMSRLREGAVTNPAAYVVSLLNNKFNNNQNNQILV